MTEYKISDFTKCTDSEGENTDCLRCVEVDDLKEMIKEINYSKIITKALVKLSNALKEISMVDQACIFNAIDVSWLNEADCKNTDCENCIMSWAIEGIQP